MKRIVQWAVNNGPGMNTLMLAIMLVGAVSLALMRREVFPEFELDIIIVTVPYPGASPEEVEEGICEKIEEAVRSISGIKKQTAVAREGSGYLILELESNVPDAQRILSEVRSEVDRIPSFPLLAEDPEVKQITIRQPAIRVGIIGPEATGLDAELALREVSEQVRSDLLQLPGVSQANLLGAKEYQIDIEIPERTLRTYGLTLQQVAAIVRRENLELPGGNLKGKSEEILLRGKNRSSIGAEIADIPLVTKSNGTVLTVKDLAIVRDEFADATLIHRINGKPGLVISIDRTSSEDLLAIVDDVKSYVAEKRLPAGYELTTWGDRSVDVRDRMELLQKNGLQGLILVFLVLAMFLELRLAFWVAMGIPISILGACGFLLYLGQTLNMLSMFAFLMALGIIVDDAIVVGENIYAHRQRGSGMVKAAIDGTVEVLPSVAAAVATTIIAFVPLMFVSGVMGKFIAVMPVAIIMMLLISLFESTLILPCHLGHRDGLFFLIVGFVFYPLKPIVWLFAWLNRHAERAMQFVIDRIYLPILSAGLRNPGVALSVAAGILIVAAGFVRSGVTPFVVFPKIDSNSIEAKVIYPSGTPSPMADAATQRLEQAIRRVNERHAAEGMPILTLTHRLVGEVQTGGALGQDARTNGGNVGGVEVELTDTSARTLTSQQLIAEWREEAGEFPGADSLSFGSQAMGPGGTPIEFKLLAPSSDVAALEAAVEQCKERLNLYPGVFDVQDDSREGKWEFQLKIRDQARSMGIPLADLAETVRASYYGEEVMRLQRGRHEVKLMVRYPKEDRRSLSNFQEIRVRTNDGVERPLTELADVTIGRGPSEINRVNQLRSITITSDLDEAVGNAREIVADLQKNLVPELAEEFPSVRVRWEGQQEQTAESIQSLGIGLAVALVAMFALLTLEFQSYLQPLLILAIIPFGIIGAICGHALLGMPLTLFSVFGLVALTGVVVNDSIVLIDFINHRIRAGVPLNQALLDAGSQRFRPVFLTSVTTIAGLLPILMETSFQAQILIPMATSLVFGLGFTTLLVLFLVPTFYQVYASLLTLFKFDVTHHDPSESPFMEHGDDGGEPLKKAELAVASDHYFHSEK